MRLERLKATDFRGFKSLELELDRQLTVLVGPNGGGKSTILRAIAMAASHLADVVFQLDRHGRIPSDEDVRIGASMSSIEATWEGGYHSAVRFEGDEMEQRTDEPPPSVPPLCLDYDVDRARTRAPAGARVKPRASTHAAWDEDQRPAFVGFEQLSAWFREREDIENQERVRTRNLDLVDPALDAVRRAVSACLGPSYGLPRIDRSRGTRLLLPKGDVVLSADQLSDGERSLLVVAADMARRLFLLEPTPADPLAAEALVLIDEVELHLHPAWQRQVLPTLTRTFPNAQFVVSTHSPAVLSETLASSVRLVEDFRVYTPTTPVRGRDANSLLREIFDSPVRPRFVEDMISVASDAIDEGKLEDARGDVDRLAAIVGEGDSEVVRLRVLLGFVERAQRATDEAPT